MNKAIKLLIVLNILLTTYIVYDTSHKPKPIKIKQVNVDSLYKVIDSLEGEAYLWERTVDRYDIAIEYYKEKYPKQGDKLEECFKNIE